MARVYTVDLMMHFGTLLIASVWTVASFVMVAQMGDALAGTSGGAGGLMLNISWLFPVVGLFACWTCLRMPYVAVLTESGHLHFEAVLGRPELAVADLKGVSKDRLGWFVTFEGRERTVRMLARINGLDGMVRTLRSRNRAMEVDGF